MSRFTKTRIWLRLLFFIACGLTSSCAIYNYSEAPAVRFLVIGDWGNGASEPQRRVAGSMDAFAALHTVDFIVTTGDNMYPHGVTAVDDPLWQKSFENVYRLPNLGYLNWYPVFGILDQDIASQIQIDKVAGFHQVISGSGSKLRAVSDTEESLFKQSINGFAFIETTIEGIRISLVSSEGRELYSHDISNSRRAKQVE